MNLVVGRALLGHQGQAGDCAVPVGSLVVRPLGTPLGRRALCMPVHLLGGLFEDALPELDAPPLRDRAEDCHRAEEHDVPGEGLRKITSTRPTTATTAPRIGMMACCRSRLLFVLVNLLLDGGDDMFNSPVPRLGGGVLTPPGQHVRQRAGLPITFDALAREARVSRSWLYNQPDLRAEVERLRARRSPPSPNATNAETYTEST